MRVLWTTYIWGNHAARRLYERVGFVETDVVEEEDIHEVNMVLAFAVTLRQRTVGDLYPAY